jgi:GNAT superfamily N-acetyltransferase
MNNSITFTLRQLTPEDSLKYGKLITESPDTGAIRVSQRFEIDPYITVINAHPGSVGVVAETPEYDGFIGAGLVRLGRCQWEGRDVPYALLNTLVVHPNFRRRGVASQLAKWREEYARQQFGGEEGVTFAIIQKNNTGSELTAKKWYRQFLADRLIVIPMNVRSKPPAQMTGFIVREISGNEMEEVAAKQNRFYKNYNLYPTETAENLVHWCNESPFDTPFHHYFVVTDRSDNILAGAGLSENGRMRKLIVEHVPPMLEFLNRFLTAVPADRVMRELNLSRIWFGEGQLKAARYLFETIRWEWRDKGTSIMNSADARSPIMEVYAVRPWTIKSGGGVALRAPTDMPEDRLIYYA